MEQRENNFTETYKSLRENRNRRASEHEKIVSEAVAKQENFRKEYHSIMESREQRQRRHGQLMESCRNNAFGTALKAIYITALEAATLTDNGIILAETMVDSWIKENGGASKILGECQNKTYLLARISQIVEEAAIIEADELEKIADDVEDQGDPEAPAVEDNTGEDDDEVALATKVIEKKLDAENDEEVKKALEVIQKKAAEATPDTDPVPDSGEEPVDDDASKEETPDDKSTDSDDSKEDDSKIDPEEETPAEDDSEDPLTDGFDDDESDDSSEDDKDVELPDDPTTTSDDNETDTADDITDDLDDIPDEDTTIDGDAENNGKVFDELEKEEDVKKAIDLIRNRVADAEETFIKRNAEDKKAIDELIGRISDNVKTVEDISDEDSAESKVAQEAARIGKQKINEITENRPLTIMEKMARNLHSSIVKNQVVREQYLVEDGSMDTGLIVESAKVMYGFLETLNTLQLEKVDAKYIQKILTEM